MLTRDRMWIQTSLPYLWAMGESLSHWSGRLDLMKVAKPWESRNADAHTSSRSMPVCPPFGLHGHCIQHRISKGAADGCYPRLRCRQGIWLHPRRKPSRGARRAFNAYITLYNPILYLYIYMCIYIYTLV